NGLPVLTFKRFAQRGLGGFQVFDGFLHEHCFLEQARADQSSFLLLSAFRVASTLWLVALSRATRVSMALNFLNREVVSDSMRRSSLIWSAARDSLASLRLFSRVANRPPAPEYTEVISPM